MTTTDSTRRGTIRSGEDPTSAGGNDIDVEVSEKDFNAYLEGEGGKATWLVLRTGVAEFYDVLANTYKWLEVGGMQFRILTIRPQGTDKNKLLVTVEHDDTGSSTAYLE